VLVNSFDAAERIGTRLGHDTLLVTTHRRGERFSRALARYGTGPGVLISPSAWEGVDTGVRWDDVIIPRLPYPPRNEVLNEHWLHQQAQAARRLQQGIARGTREREQVCRVWLLDIRMLSEPHHTRVVNAIPKRFRQGRKASWPQRKVWRC
jgi:Rad3-related DNA helicase